MNQEPIKNKEEQRKFILTQKDNIVNQIANINLLLSIKCPDILISFELRELDKTTNPKFADLVKSDIEAFFNVEDLAVKSRKRHIILARNFAIYLIRKNTTMSLNEISRHFGNKDHATMLHSIQTFEADFATNKIYQIDCLNNLQRLKAKNIIHPSFNIFLTSNNTIVNQ